MNQFKAGANNKAIELICSLPEAAIWIEGDAARLSRVLHNLLQNACIYTEAGGKIYFQFLQSGNFAEIRVKDTGIGIPPEKSGNIFERFYRLDPSRTRETGGAGLGLAIAKAFAELRAGKIQAHSPGICGQGTEIRIHLPIR